MCKRFYFDPFSSVLVELLWFLRLLYFCLFFKNRSLQLIKNDKMDIVFHFQMMSSFLPKFLSGCGHTNLIFVLNYGCDNTIGFLVKYNFGNFEKRFPLILQRLLELGLYLSYEKGG